MPHYTLTQVRESFNPNIDDGPIISKYFLRPASFYVTYLLLKLGIRRPNQVTGLCLFCGIISAIFFILGQRTFFSLGVFFYLCFWIFDYSDGNIARVTDLATYYGKFLDGVVDTLIETLLPFSLCLGVYFTRHHKLFLFTGFSFALLSLFISFLINRVSFFNRWLKMENSDRNQNMANLQNLNPLKSDILPLEKIYNISTDLKILVLLAAVFAGMTNFLFLVFLATLLVWALSTLIVTLLNAAKQLNVHRVSKFDSRLLRKKE